MDNEFEQQLTDSGLGAPHVQAVLAEPAPAEVRERFQQHLDEGE